MEHYIQVSEGVVTINLHRAIYSGMRHEESVRSTWIEQFKQISTSMSSNVQSTLMERYIQVSGGVVSIKLA